MLVAVKKPHTKSTLFEMKGNIPKEIIDYLKTGYTVILEDNDQLPNLLESKWFKEMETKMTPGKYLKIYRENFNYSQTKLAEMIGSLTRQNVSGMENDRRGISKEMAKKLSKIFNVPVERFI